MKKFFLSLVILALLLVSGKKIGNFFFPPRTISKVIIKEGEISPGGSLYTALRKDFPAREVVALGKALSKVYNINKVKSKDQFIIYHSTYGKILKFIYKPSPLVNYVVERTTAGFVSYKNVPEIEERLVAVKGTIKNSLYEGMVNSGIDVTSIMKFADIFQWQIDFFTEVRAGDKFLAVWTQYFVDGRAVKSGPVFLAAYKGKRGNFTAIRFKDNKFHNYYNAAGESLRKQFLRAPLNYTRISSYFSYKRMHPILKYVRPHLGIDYSAPMGTPVSSVGSGKVVFAGWKGESGRLVIVRHNSQYRSYYCHLSRFAKGIKKGKFVNQGDIIGYVGSTGLSSGPHLDFRLKSYGKPVNFLRLKFPPAKSVSKKNRDLFAKKVEEARKYLRYLESDFFIGAPALIEEYRVLYQAELQE